MGFSMMAQSMKLLYTLNSNIGAMGVWWNGSAYTEVTRIYRDSANIVLYTNGNSIIERIYSSGAGGSTIFPNPFAIYLVKYTT